MPRGGFKLRKSLPGAGKFAHLLSQRDVLTHLCHEPLLQQGIEHDSLAAQDGASELGAESQGAKSDGAQNEPITNAIVYNQQAPRAVGATSVADSTSPRATVPVSAGDSPDASRSARFDPLRAPAPFSRRWC